MGLAVNDIFSFSFFQQLTGNSDKNTVVVNWLSSPFEAQYVRIIPKTYHSGLCMRMDLFACKDCTYSTLKQAEYNSFGRLV